MAQNIVHYRCCLNMEIANDISGKDCPYDITNKVTIIKLSINDIDILYIEYAI